MGSYCFHCRQPYCLLCHVQVAPKFCIQNGVELVDICFSRDSGAGSVIIYCELAELEGGEEKPGGGLEV